MSEDSPRSIRAITFISIISLSLILLLNLILGNVAQVPRFPGWKDFISAMAYSAGFITALMSGAAMSSRYVLTGILVTVVFPWMILALVFRRNVFRIILSLGIYAVLLTAISWIISFFRIPTAPLNDRSVLVLFAGALNFPFAHLFHLAYLLIGHALYPLPLLLLAAAWIRRFKKGEKPLRVYRGLFWGYLEMVLLTALFSFWIEKLYGGILIEWMGDSVRQLGGSVLLAFVFLISLFEFVLYCMHMSHKELWKRIQGKKEEEAEPSI